MVFASALSCCLRYFCCTCVFVFLRCSFERMCEWHRRSRREPLCSDLSTPIFSFNALSWPVTSFRFMVGLCIFLVYHSRLSAGFHCCLYTIVAVYYYTRQICQFSRYFFLAMMPALCCGDVSLLLLLPLWLLHTTRNIPDGLHHRLSQITSCLSRSPPILTESSVLTPRNLGSRLSFSDRRIPSPAFSSFLV